MKELQNRIILRLVAFVYALRVFLRKRHDYNEIADEYLEVENEYNDNKDLLSENEFKSFSKRDNPPNYLLQTQSQGLKKAYANGSNISGIQQYSR